MWDPVTVFSIMWLLNVKELPCQRLNVLDVVKDKQTIATHAHMVTLREEVQ
jgi:hypothetical protein